MPGTPSASLHWVSAWGAATTGTYPLSYNTDADTRRNTPEPSHSFRLFARSTLGGTAVRIRLSNQPGSTPLTVGSARVGLRSSGAALVAGSSMPVTFGGATSTVIAAGAQLISDPVPLAVAAGDDVAVSLYLPGTVQASTVHALALQTNYVSVPGNFTAAAYITQIG